MIPNYERLVKDRHKQLARRYKIVSACFVCAVALGFLWNMFNTHHDASAGYDDYVLEDGDNDGVADIYDACLETRRGVKVDKKGCEIVPPEPPKRSCKVSNVVTFMPRFGCAPCVVMRNNINQVTDIEGVAFSSSAEMVYGRRTYVDEMKEYPMTLFLDENGEVLSRLPGLQTVPDLASHLDPFCNNPAIDLKTSLIRWAKKIAK